MIASVGLIGDPVAHSISPVFQNAAFRACGRADTYALWHTSSAELAERVASLRAPGMLGANVTIPHKVAVVPCMDELDPVAAAVGAVNTIVRLADGRLRGQNTDVPGFLRSLDVVGFRPRGARCILLGAGGAARAVAYGLVLAGARSLTVVNRTYERGEELLADVLAATELDPELLVLTPDAPELADAVANAELVVNATSLGLKDGGLPLAAELLGPHLLVTDLIYRTTPLLAAAAARGARTQDGLEMLIQQGALSFEAWTGVTAPLDEMRAAAQERIEERT